MTDASNEFVYPVEVAIRLDEEDFTPEGMAVCSYCLGVVPVIASVIHIHTGEWIQYYPDDWWDAHNPGCPFNEPLPRECEF